MSEGTHIVTRELPLGQDPIYYVHVDVEDTFGWRGTTLEDIASHFRLNTDQVFTALFAQEYPYRGNDEAIRHLWKWNVAVVPRDPSDHDSLPPCWIEDSDLTLEEMADEYAEQFDLADIRQQLLARSVQWDSGPDKTFHRIESHLSDTWFVPPEVRMHIPLSSLDLTHVFEDSYMLRSRNAKVPRSDELEKLERAWIRIRTHLHSVGALEEQWGLNYRTKLLVGALERDAEIAAKNARQVALLNQLDLMMRFMREQAEKRAPKKSFKLDEENLERFDTLHQALKELLEEAQRAMLLEPIAYRKPGSGNPKVLAYSVLEALRPNPAQDPAPNQWNPRFREDVEYVLQWVELADPLDLDDLYDSVAYAGRALLRSPLAEKFFEEEVAPLLGMVSKLYQPLGDELKHVRDLDFKAILERAGSRVFNEDFQDAKSVLNSIVKGAAGSVGATKALKGLRGPGKLTMTLISHSLVNILEAARGKNNFKDAAGALYKALCAASPDMTVRDRWNLIAQVEAQTFEDLKSKPGFDYPEGGSRPKLTGKVLAGHGISVVATLVIFAYSFASYDNKTFIKSSADLISSFGSATEAVAQALLAFEKYADSQVLKTLSGTTISRIAGVAGIAAGVMATREEIEDRDDYGAFLSGWGTVGAGMTFASTFFVAGFTASGTVVLAPVGVFLLVVGTLLAVGTFALGLIEELTGVTTKGMMDLYTKKFPDLDGKVPSAIEKDSDVRKKWERVRELLGEWELFGEQTEVEFWTIDPKHKEWGLEALIEAGFGPWEIEQICGVELAPDFDRYDKVWVNAKAAERGMHASVTYEEYKDEAWGLGKTASERREDWHYEVKDDVAGSSLGATHRYHEQLLYRRFGRKQQVKLYKTGARQELWGIGRVTGYRLKEAPDTIIHSLLTSRHWVYQVEFEIVDEAFLDLQPDRRGKKVTDEYVWDDPRITDMQGRLSGDLWRRG